MICKLIEKDDISNLINLRVEYFKEAYSEFTYKDCQLLTENMNHYLSEHLNKDCFGFITMDGKKAISCGIVNVFEKVPNKHFPNGIFAGIYGVFTLKSYRRNGYATEIINNVIRLMKNKEVSFIELEASDDGFGVYEKCGFVSSESKYKKMKYLYNEKEIWIKEMMIVLHMQRLQSKESLKRVENLG